MSEKTYSVATGKYFLSIKHIFTNCYLQTFFKMYYLLTCLLKDQVLTSVYNHMKAVVEMGRF